MGHLTLISEDVITALQHYPPDLKLRLAKYAPQPDWDAALDDIDEEFYEDKDNLFERVVCFAVEKGLIPPIEH